MDLKKEIVRFARLLDSKGLTVGQEGNISVRLPGNGRFLITPSGKMKSFLEKKDIVEIDGNGSRTGGRENPSSEKHSHLEIYRNNPGFGAVVHAHPFFTLLLNAAGEDPFRKKFLAESAMFLREAVVLPFAKPSTREGADLLRNVPVGTKIIVADRHGCFTCGRDLAEAFSLLEILEKHCRMVYCLGLAGKEPRCFSVSEIAELEKAANDYLNSGGSIRRKGRR